MWSERDLRHFNWIKDYVERSLEINRKLRGLEQRKTVLEKEINDLKNKEIK